MQGLDEAPERSPAPQSAVPPVSPRPADAVEMAILQGLDMQRQPLDVGSEIKPYRLQERLSERGNLIWKAYDERLARTVVVRIFNPEKYSKDARLPLARAFWDGARLMATLDRVARCPVLLAGPEIHQGWLWFAIEYYPTRDLETALRLKSIKQTEKERLFDEIASALTEVHGSDSVHRDVGLDNVLLMPSSEGQHAYLSDFDYSRLQLNVVGDRSGAYYVRDGSPVPVPERTPRDDVRALCYLLFKLYTSLEAEPPVSPTRAALRAELARQRVDPMIRSRVARICARGLGSRGFDDAAQVRDEWRRRGAERWATLVGFMLVLCTLCWAFLILDFLICAHEQSAWVHAISYLLGSAGVLGIGASVVGLVRPTVPALYATAAEWSGAYPGRAIAAAFVLCLINVTTCALTHLKTRLESYYFESPQGCRVATVGNLVDLNSVKDNKGAATLIWISGARTLSCEKKPTYWGASFFTRELDFQEPKKPDTPKPCEASATAAIAGSVAPATAKPPIPATSAALLASHPNGGHRHAIATTPLVTESAVAVSEPSPPTPPDPEVGVAASKDQSKVDCLRCDADADACIHGCVASYSSDPGHMAACRVYCDSSLKYCRSSKCQ